MQISVKLRYKLMERQFWGLRWPTASATFRIWSRNSREERVLTTMLKLWPALLVRLLTFTVRIIITYITWSWKKYANVSAFIYNLHWELQLGNQSCNHRFNCIRLKFSPISGCVNGGAQIRPEGGVSAKDLVRNIEAAYENIPVSNPDTEWRVSNVYSEWLGGGDSEKVHKFLHTQYKSIEKSTNALGIKW